MSRSFADLKISNPGTSGLDDGLSFVSGQNTLHLVTSNITSNREITLPDASTTLVGTDAPQILTNKTINGALVDSATITSSTIIADANNVRANRIGDNLANQVSLSGSALAGYVLKATGSSAATWLPTAGSTASIQTTDANPHTILTLATNDLASYLLSARITARIVVGTHAGRALSCRLTAAFERSDGSGSLARIAGDDLFLYSNFNDATSTLNIGTHSDTSNGVIHVRVTGEAGQTVYWYAAADLDESPLTAPVTINP
jgi:hypothetical protein